VNAHYDRLMKCYEYFRSVTDFKPGIGVVLGSGLGNYAQNMKVVCDIPYGDIPGFPVSTVPGHDGRFLLGYIGETPVVVMKGRVHYYEGYSMEEVVLPIRLMKMMGIGTLLLTNAAGAINRYFKEGDFMIIKDQISSFVPSPLIGENLCQLGERFPDMTHVYDPGLQELIKKTAKREKIQVREGIYVQTTGPNFESPAEIKMYGFLGADAVGMSTTCEAIAARHAGVKVCGISCISNMAAGITGEILSHLDVQAIANKRADDFERLITSFIQEVEN